MQLLVEMNRMVLAPEVANSPTWETIMTSIVPTRMPRNCSITSGKINAFSCLFVNTEDAFLSVAMLAGYLQILLHMLAGMLRFRSPVRAEALSDSLLKPV